MTVATSTPQIPNALPATEALSTLLGRFCQSLRDIKSSATAPPAQVPKTDNCQMPSIYLQICHVAGVQNSKLKGDED